MNKCFLYFIEFPNGKKYIGISSNVKNRFKIHKILAETEKGHLVHSAIRKYGWNNIEKKIICVSTTEYIKEMEIKAIQIFNTLAPFGYNLTKGGDGAFGRKLSVEQKEEIRNRMIGNSYTKGKIYSKEEISSRRKWFHDEETKAKIGAKHTGKFVSEETREKIRNSKLGKRMSIEGRAKLSLALLGNKRKAGISPTKEQRKLHSKEMKLYYSQKRSGIHSLTMKEWFSKIRNSSK